MLLHHLLLHRLLSLRDSAKSRNVVLRLLRLSTRLRHHIICCGRCWMLILRWRVDDVVIVIEGDIDAMNKSVALVLVLLIEDDSIRGRVRPMETNEPARLCAKVVQTLCCELPAFGFRHLHETASAWAMHLGDGWWYSACHLIRSLPVATGSGGGPDVSVHWRP